MWEYCSKILLGVALLSIKIPQKYISLYEIYKSEYF